VQSFESAAEFEPGRFDAADAFTFFIDAKPEPERNAYSNAKTSDRIGIKEVAGQISL